jgi:hypothetical protein
LFEEEASTGENVVVLIHLPVGSSAFAVPDRVGREHAGRAFEYAVVSIGHNPSVYAHELLHLFGADDYYRTYSAAIWRMKVPYLAKSIMFSGGIVPLKRLVVDELTAQNIGWM